MKKGRGEQGRGGIGGGKGGRVVAGLDGVHDVPFLVVRWLKCECPPCGRALRSAMSLNLDLIQVWQVRRINTEFSKIFFAFVLCWLRRFPQVGHLTRNLPPARGPLPHKFPPRPFSTNW